MFSILRQAVTELASDKRSEKGFLRQGRPVASGLGEGEIATHYAAKKSGEKS